MPARHCRSDILSKSILCLLVLLVCPNIAADEATTLVYTPDGNLAVYWYEIPGSHTTVILGHGYLSHARFNQRAIDFFLGKGYNVLAWDLPGHGNSWGKPGAIDDFMQYARAFDAILVHARDKRHADTLSFVGHSTSCTVFMTWHRELWNTGASTLKGGPFPVDKVVFVAPLVRSWLFGLSNFGWRVGRWFIQELRPRTGAGSHRSGYKKDFFADPLTVKRMPVSWMEPYLAWELGSRSWMADPLPFLVVQGTSDTALDWRYNLKFLFRVYPEARAELIEKGWHCLLDEADPWASRVYGLLDREFQVVSDTVIP
jgi:alpha-beta hydrolase superfamily lysophospholipase